MSVGGVSGASLVNQSIVSSQSQQSQIQNPFQKIAQQFQSGTFSAQQPNALPQSPSATGTLATPGNVSPANWSGVQSSTQAHAHGHHHRVRANDGDADSDTDSEPTNSPSLGQLGQAIQAGNSSSAQQAYGSVQQDLQQIALNSDLISAQSAALQASSLSLTA